MPIGLSVRGAMVVKKKNTGPTIVDAIYAVFNLDEKHAKTFDVQEISAALPKTVAQSFTANSIATTKHLLQSYERVVKAEKHARKKPS